MEHAPLRQSPPLLQNRYRITAKLGATRLALVYRAVDERLQRPVLVHLLRPEQQEEEALRQRFVDEARRRVQRPHPSLLEVYDVGEVRQRPYLVTEDVEGIPLQEALPLPPHEAMRILRQIVGATIACQESGLPTPPITSGSILLSKDARPVLAEPWWLSPEELVLHLAHYRAPERSRGRPPEPATPVYNLGILAYELLGGRRPYSGDSPKAVALMHLQQPLPPAIEVVHGFTPRMAQVLIAATARDPIDRLPDVAGLQRELASVEGQTDMPTQPLSLPQRPLRQAMRESLRPVTGALRRNTERGTLQRRPPPPPPLWGPPPASTMASAAAQPQVADVRRQVEQEVRRELRWKGCRRRLVRLAFKLALVVALLGGGYWAYNYSLSWFEGGGARDVCHDRLPAIVCERFPGGGTYVVKSDLNLRAAPSIETGNVLGTLAPGTRVEQFGDARTVENITWLPVRTELNGAQVEGWVSVDYLREAQ